MHICAPLRPARASRGRRYPAARGWTRADRGLGRSRLGHPRPDAGAGRAAAPGGADRRRPEGRLPLVPALALVGGLADLPDRARPGRARRLRHPRVPPRRQPPAAGLVPLDPRPDLAAAAVGGRADDAARQRAADLSPARHQGHLDRRRRGAAGRDLQPPAGGRAARRLADQRRIVDDVPPPAARPDRRRRGRQPPPRGGDAHADGREPVGRRLHGVRVARPDPALPARVRPPRPPGVPAGVRHAGRRPRPRRLPAARPRAGDAARAHRAGRPGAADVRPRPPAVHPGAQHEPGARAPRPAEDGPRLGAGLAARLGPHPLDGPQDLRPARPARQGWRADHADRLGAHPRLHQRHVDRRGRVARAARTRAPGHRGHGRRRPRARRGRAGAARVHRPGHRARPIGKVRRKEEVLSRALPRPRTRPAAGGGAALQPDPRAADGASRRTGCPATTAPRASTSPPAPASRRARAPRSR